LWPGANDASTGRTSVVVEVCAGVAASLSLGISLRSIRVTRRIGGR
jgi:hypothetical protein